MTREKLVSLSDNDLFEIALKHNVILPQEREVIIDELTDELDLLSNNGSLHASFKRYEFSKPTCNGREKMSSYSFPKQYNQNILYCVLRDPYWVFVDWEIAKSSYRSAITSSEFNGFFLRMIALDEQNGCERLVDRYNYAIQGITGHCFIKLIDVTLTHKVALFADLGGVEALIVSAKPLYQQAKAKTCNDLTNCRASALQNIAEREL